MARKWSNLNLPGAPHFVTGKLRNEEPFRFLEDKEAGARSGPIWRGTCRSACPLPNCPDLVEFFLLLPTAPAYCRLPLIVLTPE